jgi:hypothetical protein
MYRLLLPSLIVAALTVGLASPEPAAAQSKKKLGGPIVDLGGMKSQVFDFWKPQKASPPFLHDFLLPKDLKTDQDAAFVTIYPITGKTEQILIDWKNRWLPPKGFKLENLTRTESFKVGAASVTKLNIQGTYLQTAKPDDSIAEAKKMDDYRMQAYVFEVKDQKYAIQLIGPFRTVGLHQPDLDTWVKAFK